MSDMVDGDDGPKKKPMDSLKDTMNTIRNLKEGTEEYSRRTKRSIENNKKLMDHYTNFSDDFQQKNASSDSFEFAWGIAKGDNAPTNPSLWSQAKSKARSKFDVYPSAYANAWASKWYKSKGGGWKKKSKKGKK
jgi:hypothetical protein